MVTYTLRRRTLALLCSFTVFRNSIFEYVNIEALATGCMIHKQRNQSHDRFWINHESCFITLFLGRRCCDRMIVGFITAYAVSAYHH